MLDSYFVDAIFTNPSSRLAVAKFGTETWIMQGLTKDVNKWRGTSGYKWKNMETTFTGNAMDNVLPDFKEKIVGSEASKVLVVITDGAHTEGSTAPKQAAQKWKALGATVYAI